LVFWFQSQLELLDELELLEAQELEEWLELPDTLLIARPPSEKPLVEAL
jgi:hypothetical protein